MRRGQVVAATVLVGVCVAGPAGSPSVGAEQPATTRTTVTTLSGPTAYPATGGPVRFVATVAKRDGSPTPAGHVDFVMGQGRGNVLASQPVDNMGVATVDLALSPYKQQGIKAFFVGADGTEKSSSNRVMALPTAPYPTRLNTGYKLIRTTSQGLTEVGINARPGPWSARYDTPPPIGAVTADQGFACRPKSRERGRVYWYCEGRLTPGVPVAVTVTFPGDANWLPVTSQVLVSP